METAPDGLGTREYIRTLRLLDQQLGQVSGGEAVQIFWEHLRGFVLKMICEVMAVEVDQLCGPKHQPTGGDLFRAGNSSGRVLVDGEREEVIRPRVRERQQSGSTSEVALASYESAATPTNCKLRLCWH